MKIKDIKRGYLTIDTSKGWFGFIKAPYSPWYKWYWFWNIKQ